jgi:hypothetical protein
MSATAPHVKTSRPGVDQALPRLLDCRSLRRELDITRAAAEAIMRQLPVIEPPGLRKVYVRRADVHTFLESCLRFK